MPDHAAEPTRPAPAAGPDADSSVIGVVAADATVRRFAGSLAEGRRVSAVGAAGSSTVFLAAAVSRLTGRGVLVCTAHLDEAEEARDELESQGVACVRFPALQALPGEAGASLELYAARAAAVRDVARAAGSVGPGGLVVVAPVQALMQAAPDAASIDRSVRALRRGDRSGRAALLAWLDAAGYARTDAAEDPGTFAARGGIVDIFPAVGGSAVRVEFDGDAVDRLTEIDPETMGPARDLEAAELVCAAISPEALDTGLSFLHAVPAGVIALIADRAEVSEQARGYFERATDARGLFAPPAVLDMLRGRFHASAEVNATAGPGGAAFALPFEPSPHLPRDVTEAVGALAAHAAAARVIVPCDTPGDRSRLGELVREHAGGAAIDAPACYVHRGFRMGPSGGDGPPGRPVLVVPYHELLGRFQRRRPAARIGSGRAMDAFLEVRPGDYVVHADHGIARFVGLVRMTPRHVRDLENARRVPDMGPGLLEGGPRRRGGGGPSARGGAGSPSGAGDRSAEAETEEFLLLEFAGKSKLYVPATQIDLVQKYVGGFRGRPTLATLGGQRWKSQKERVAESVRDLAAELLRVRAARESMPGVRYPADTAWQRQFEAEFPFQETDDQTSAMAAIKRDMQADRPMDRLVCGDVGFGKTELAMRAIFKAVESGRQAAVLVPTTVLAEQHEQTFRDRFAGYPFRVESLSRFKSDREIAATLTEVRAGRVDVIIGTHRLLSRDVRFADLGLVVIDEEQRFGVEHKEQLLRLRLSADVLTLSATPIPRTLHMSMLGLRDISSLATAPPDRQAVVTEVTAWNDRRIERAISRELARDGQVFFVHNRVYNIRSAADQVQRLAPAARIVVGHGQMPGPELESVMLRFMRRQADILVCTTIIESGIDIPTANTIIIADADRFGLADLHQLRGRVGRSRHRAYCYLLLPQTRTPTAAARQRLAAVEQYSMLGAGFKIAMRDLEIRGAGNLLGKEQSGHIAVVGYEMYCRLLDQAVKTLRNEARPEPARTSVELGVTGTIPAAYIPSETRRLEVYRRLSQARDAADLARLSADLAGAYGAAPRPVQRLLDLALLRLLATELDVRTVTVRDRDVVFRTPAPAVAAERLGRAAPDPPRQAGTGDRPGRMSRRDGDAPAGATVRVLPPKSGDELHEIYFRMPGTRTAPETLLAVLLQRLAPGPAPAHPAPSPPDPGPQAQGHQAPRSQAPGPQAPGRAVPAFPPRMSAVPVKLPPPPSRPEPPGSRR